MNEKIDEYANDILLPEMKKVFPKSNIRKEIIGEVTGFDRIEKSEAVSYTHLTLPTKA